MISRGCLSMACASRSERSPRFPFHDPLPREGNWGSFFDFHLLESVRNLVQPGFEGKRFFIGHCFLSHFCPGDEGWKRRRCVVLALKKLAHPGRASEKMSAECRVFLRTSQEIVEGEDFQVTSICLTPCFISPFFSTGIYR